MCAVFVFTGMMMKRMGEGSRLLLAALMFATLSASEVVEWDLAERLTRYLPGRKFPSRGETKESMFRRYSG